MSVPTVFLSAALAVAAGLLLLALVVGGLVLLVKALRLGALPWLTLGAVAGLCGMALLFLQGRPQGPSQLRLSTSPRAGEVALPDPQLAGMPVVEQAAADSDVPPRLALPDRPAPDWVTDPPDRREGSTPTVIRSGPHARILDCERVLNEELHKVVRAYVDENIAHAKGLALSLPPAGLRDLVVVDEHVETRRHSFGDMHEVYQRLSIGREAHDQLWLWARQAVVQQRLRQAGVGLAAVLLALLTICSCLRVDDATQGRYRRRLGWSAATLCGLLASGATLLLTHW
ncbi:MAG: hypothetical protein GTO62_06570 [Planctomycetales bacterium]|nr:hypothetical protein [Planctomycetales bacterium]NIP85023.1 hypothetical protein [Planctomycetales bacterium]